LSNSERFPSKAFWIKTSKIEGSTGNIPEIIDEINAQL
jgi:hypothetical protein